MNGILLLVCLLVFAYVVPWGIGKALDFQARREESRVTAKLDGWRPVKPYPGLFAEGASGRYVDRLLAMHPSDRTLYALKCAFEDEQRTAPQKDRKPE